MDVIGIECLSSRSSISIFQDDIDQRGASENYRLALELFPMKDIHPVEAALILIPRGTPILR